MNAPTAQGIQIDRKGGHKGLSFTRCHFSDFPLVKHDTPNELDIKMAFPECSLACLPDHSKGLEEQIVNGFTTIYSLAKLSRLCLEFGIVELLDGIFQAIDVVDHGSDSPNFTFILGADDLLDDRKHRSCFSFDKSKTLYCLPGGDSTDENR